MKRCFGLIFCFLFFVCLWFSAMDEQLSVSLSDKLLRLHVIAASDAPEAQRQKLLVRDAVLETLTPAIMDCDTLPEAEAAVEAALPQLQTAAEEALRQAGSSDSVTVSLSTEQYPLRRYAFFALPGGSYRSLRIRIGPAGGHNWWCVVFPPLCLAAAEEEAEEALEVFSPSQRRMITSGGYVIRFRLLDFWHKLQAMK